jgi:hypothetical protein
MLLETVGWVILFVKIDKRITFRKGRDDEIKREDDVYLQGVTYLSAILFFYVNTLPAELNALKVPLSVLIIFSTVPFYCFRAYAKIKNSPEYRVISMFVFLFLTSNYVFQLAVLFIPAWLLPWLFTVHPIFQILFILGLSAIPLSFFALAFLYFPKRYGYFPKISINKEGRFPKLQATNVLEDQSDDCL